VKLETYRVRLTDTDTKVRTILKSPPCVAGSLEARSAANSFFKSLAEDPNLMNCGDRVFQNFKMYHDGTNWVAELEAINTTPKG